MNKHIEENSNNNINIFFIQIKGALANAPYEE